MDAMAQVSQLPAALRPGAFCQQLLKALDASEGRTKRRKRDQTPDTIGLEIKRTLLSRAAESDPGPDAFEGWLMAEAFATSASGGVRAMCATILEDYRLASVDATFHSWLEEGAHSADAEDSAEGAHSRRDRPDVVGQGNPAGAERKTGSVRVSPARVSASAAPGRARGPR
jgi:hypothetical protein